MTLAVFAFALFMAVPDLERGDVTAAYEHAPACESGVTADKSCRQTFSAVVTQTGSWSHGNSKTGYGHWITLGVNTADDSARFTKIEIQQDGWSRLAVGKGDRVTVVVWDGKVMRVASAHSTEPVFGALPRHRFNLVGASLFFFAAALVLARAGRRQDLPSRRALLARRADRIGVPVLAVISPIFYLDSTTVTADLVVFVAVLTQIVSMAAMPWWVWEADPIERRTT